MSRNVCFHVGEHRQRNRHVRPCEQITISRVKARSAAMRSECVTSASVNVKFIQWRYCRYEQKSFR